MSEIPEFNTEKKKAEKEATRVARKLGLVKKCLKCGSEEEVELHHINENPFDNRPENLEYLCKVCHVQIHSPQARQREDFTRCGGCKRLRICYRSPISRILLCTRCFESEFKQKYRGPFRFSANVWDKSWGIEKIPGFYYMNRRYYFPPIFSRVGGQTQKIIRVSNVDEFKGIAGKIAEITRKPTKEIEKMSMAEIHELLEEHAITIEIKPEAIVQRNRQHNKEYSNELWEKTITNMTAVELLELVRMKHP